MKVRKPGFLHNVFQNDAKASQHGLMEDDISCAFSSDGMGITMIPAGSGGGPGWCAAAGPPRRYLGAGR